MAKAQMRLRKDRVVISTVIMLLLAGFSLLAQDKPAPAGSETRSEVPELTDFHEVVYKIWHTAWPNKDVVMLRELSSEVEQLGDKLLRAQLPGILREKKIAWDENVAKMKSIMGAYKEAVNDTNSQRLLDAAEQLHSQYEKLVRVVRPVLKELDEFHTVLYPLYHYYMPQKDLEAIKGSVAKMKEKMEVLEKASLPARFKEKQEVFVAARARLAAALKTLDGSLSSTQPGEIDKNINQLHSRYEELSKIFE
jgi:hypothetical protein